VKRLVYLSVILAIFGVLCAPNTFASQTLKGPNGHSVSEAQVNWAYQHIFNTYLLIQTMQDFGEMRLIYHCKSHWFFSWNHWRLRYKNESDMFDRTSAHPEERVDWAQMIKCYMVNMEDEDTAMCYRVFPDDELEDARDALDDLTGNFEFDNVNAQDVRMKEAADTAREYLKDAKTALGVLLKMAPPDGAKLRIKRAMIDPQFTEQLKKAGIKPPTLYPAQIIAHLEEPQSGDDDGDGDGVSDGDDGGNDDSQLKPPPGMGDDVSTTLPSYVMGIDTSQQNDTIKGGIVDPNGTKGDGIPIISENGIPINQADQAAQIGYGGDPKDPGSPNYLTQLPNAWNQQGVPLNQLPQPQDMWGNGGPAQADYLNNFPQSNSCFPGAELGLPVSPPGTRIYVLGPNKQVLGVLVALPGPSGPYNQQPINPVDQMAQRQAYNEWQQQTQAMRDDYVRRMVEKGLPQKHAETVANVWLKRNYPPPQVTPFPQGIQMGQAPVMPVWPTDPKYPQNQAQTQNNGYQGIPIFPGAQNNGNQGVPINPAPQNNGSTELPPGIVINPGNTGYNDGIVIGSPTGSTNGTVNEQVMKAAMTEIDNGRQYIARSYQGSLLTAQPAEVAQFLGQSVTNPQGQSKKRVDHLLVDARAFLTNLPQSSIAKHFGNGSVYQNILRQSQALTQALTACSANSNNTQAAQQVQQAAKGLQQALETARQQLSVPA